ncbi:MAG: DUF2975 domain-containing protein [Ruminococcus sp.]|nr:DUF2975 domain-containing protein [Ruminococcus sp.]
MNKTVDVNTIALEKEKKSFVKTNKVLHFVFIVLQILSLMLAIMTSIMLVMMGINAVFKISDSFSFPDIYLTLTLMVISVCYFIAFNHARKIFDIFKSGESPFRYDVADKMKGAATAIIAANLINFAIGLVYFTVGGFMKLNNDEVFEMTINFDLGNFILGILIYAFSYVFNYGAKLQQESDETL